MKCLHLASALCVLGTLLTPLPSGAKLNGLKCTLPAQDYNGLYDIRGASKSASSAAACAEICRVTSRCNMAAFVPGVQRCYPKTVPFSQPATEARAGVDLVLPQRSKLSCTDQLTSGPTPKPPPAPPVKSPPSPPVKPPPPPPVEPPTAAECTIDADCTNDYDYAGSEKQCTREGRCVDCFTNEDCTGFFPICSDEGKCQECLTDQDCASATGANGPFCTTTSFTRRTSGEGPLDVITDSTCTECRVNSDCAVPGSRGPACDDYGYCTDCVKDSDCDGSEVCEFDLCVEACQSNADCENNDYVLGPLCTSGGFCRECEDGSDCGSDRACSELAGCVGCTEDSDCSADTPFCTDNLECVECIADSDCKEDGLGSCLNDGPIELGGVCGAAPA